MDAPCKIQGSIHVFRLVNNMCPGKWVHITLISYAFIMCRYKYESIYQSINLYLYLYLDLYLYLYKGISIV